MVCDYPQEDGDTMCRVPQRKIYREVEEGREKRGHVLNFQRRAAKTVQGLSYLHGIFFDLFDFFDFAVKNSVSQV
jgi:hypothetical protein